MARIRTVKPEFWTSEQVADCSPTTRLLFIGMWNFCDDGGNHPASIKQLKMEVFPSDDILLAQIQVMIDELVKNELIAQYTVNNKDYWHVLGWKHQKIEKPNYKHPEYKKTDSEPFADHSPTIRRPFDPVMESNGMESNGICAEEKKGQMSDKPKDKMYVPPTRRTYEMFAEWSPEPLTWAQTLKLSSHLVKPEQFTDYTLLEFIRSNFGKGEKMESDWQKFYVNAIARGYIKPEGQETKPTNQPKPYRQEPVINPQYKNFNEEPPEPPRQYLTPEQRKKLKEAIK